MLGDISGVREIYIVTGYTDMRKSIDGLCAIIEEQFSMNVEYSRAVTPQIRQTGNRLSGLAETAYASLLA